ncbi:hypothetical protein D3C73_1180180 [compost metagenome]
MQDILLGHVGGFGRKVRIADTGTGGAQVLRYVGLVTDGGIEPVLHRTQLSPLAVNGLDHKVQVRHG